MKFNKKLSKQFTDFTIGKPKFTAKQHHLFADYVELIALYSKDEVSKPDILDRINDEGIKLDIDKISDKYSDEIASVKTESDDKANEWISEILDRCPVGDNLKNSTEVLIEFEDIGDELVESYSKN